MHYIPGADREQAVLFPEVIDDYIAADNPVRLLDAFVAKLDLQALGFAHAQTASTGRPPYDPGDLLRLYLYGYLNRVRSSPPPGSRGRAQPRSDLAACDGCKPRLQDDCRLPQGQRSGPQRGVPGVHPALLASSISLAANWWPSTAASSGRKTPRIATSAARASCGRSWPRSTPRWPRTCTNWRRRTKLEAAVPPRPSAAQLQEKIAALRQRGGKYARSTSPAWTRAERGKPGVAH